MLVKKKGVFTELDAQKVIEMASKSMEKEIIVMAYKVTEEAKRRLWDYQRAVSLMADLTGEKREVKVEILEGYVSDKVKGIELD
ncbi:hypothetical protein PFDSM3638_07830 [Pyrococcus furiosus DSM 3638]|uniref:Uncharacterized protein n=3 Tax=Pyrococcus furiosus TaxID=2261 RepID=A0A5C0XQR5_PYRFU|nr:MULTISPECIES: hypothetical protein [Pyrococcus]AAL81678.1 hypothetical protein PF1554 [Pyrococcus furiosus DSM 3638]AFN04336.1 hypothetical protein PFC_07000 [Pyrococcus furiosus COM1]MDK2868999.1 hypothetical protein [Pyrococcus sp.]QEK79177.1 hypothetical protein PFDSM3638_07830 [Pyrococcus furiosus DSM 3638]